MRSAFSIVRRTLLGIASLGSIACLLGHLYAIAPMSVWARFCFVPAILVVAMTWVWAWRARDEDLLLRARAGLVGGLWGTIGYDWIRVPMHAIGQNPFAPMRAYGVWIAGVSQSSPATDLLGALYQFSNGLSFGLVYAMMGMRWPWLAAVAWGLVLETLAVVTPFGQVFAIRYAPTALVVAYVGHLFYGVPLGRVCRNAALHRKPTLYSGHSHAWLMAALALAFLSWFVSAWQPVRNAPPPARTIQVGPDAIYPGWTDDSVGAELTIVNASPDSVAVRVRHSSSPADSGRMLRLAPRGAARFALEHPGVYQLLAPGRAWRSVFVSARRGSDYRTESTVVP